MIGALARLHQRRREWPWWGQALYFVLVPYVALAAYGATKPEGRRGPWFIAAGVLFVVFVPPLVIGDSLNDEPSDVATEDTTSTTAPDDGTTTAPSSTTTTESTTTTTQPIAEADRSGDSANPGELYADRPDTQSEDQEHPVGEEPARLAGYSAWVLEARHIDQASEYSTNDYIRLRVRILNRDDRTQPFSPEDWRLQAPNGQVLDPARLVIGGDELESGELVEGGQVEGHVFFLDRGLRGRYYAIYKPGPYDAARGIWGFGV